MCEVAIASCTHHITVYEAQTSGLELFKQQQFGALLSVDIFITLEEMRDR